MTLQDITDDIISQPGSPTESTTQQHNSKFDCKNCMACQTLHGMNTIQPQRTTDDPKYTADDLLHTNTTRCTVDAVTVTDADIDAKRSEIRDYFHRTFTLYEQLFSVLHNDETFYMRPDSLRHPLIFYYGHTAVFFINKLIQAGLLTERVSESIESTCAIGVDEMSWDDMNEQHYAWPSVQQLTEYRDTVRQLVDDLIQNMEFTMPITWNQSMWIVLMGIEHERIHLETSSVLFRQLPIDQIHPHTLWPVCPTSRTDKSEIPENSLVPVQGCKIRLGRYDRDVNETTELNKDSVEAVYGWDNEYGKEEFDVHTFQASKYLVTNAEYYQFWLSGGCDDQQYWTEEGWAFVQYQKRSYQRNYPKFWVPADLHVQDKSQIQFKYRSMSAVHDMPWDWPVETNYLEAYAYCKWLAQKTGKSIRLPTEAEYMCMRDEYVVEGPGSMQSDSNVNLQHFSSSTPVDQFSFTSKANSSNVLYDVIGNVWQHSETPIYAFNGFKYHDMYDDFSIPTFDTRHNLLFGGSWISTGNEAMKYARYAFRRHFYQHAGFRYIVTDQSIADTNPSKSVSLIESDPIVVQVLQEQFNDVALQQSTLHVANYDAAVAQYVVDMYKAIKPDATQLSVLDPECGVGRRTFELLTRSAGSMIGAVTAFDRTTRFIQIATALQQTKQFTYKADSNADVSINLNELCNYNTAHYSNATFMQANCDNLDSKYTGYDLVVHAKTAPVQLDQLLTALHSRLNNDGIVVFSSTEAAPSTKHSGFKTVFELRDIPRVQHVSSRQYTVDVYTLIAFQKL